MKKTEEFISIGKCAELLNIDRSHLLKNIKAGKYGSIKIEFRRDRNKQNQKVATISIEKTTRLLKGLGNLKDLVQAIL